MFLETHILQNFAPSNLNRDDTGSPKDCEFGGYRRARISSQCLKRAIRTWFREESLLPPDALAVRTKRLMEETATRLVALGRPEADARRVVQSVLASVDVRADDAGQTEYLLFLGKREIAGLAEVCQTHWDTLVTPATHDSEGAGKGKKSVKKSAREAVPKAVGEAVRTMLDGGKAADVALFGRMLADLPGANVEAAAQVAHALSTHKVSIEFDYFTAVDDLNPREKTGAGMLGTVEFNSACVYRYANVNLRQLRENLHGDTDLAGRVVQAFVRGTVEAIPTGKQNSMAAHNPPSLVFIVVREHGLWSLANAFVRPAQATGTASVVATSIHALDAYWGRLVGAYGGDGFRAQAVLCVEPDATLEVLAPYRVPSLAALLTAIESAATAGLA